MYLDVQHLTEKKVDLEKTDILITLHLHPPVLLELQDE